MYDCPCFGSGPGLGRGFCMYDCPWIGTCPCPCYFGGQVWNMLCLVTSNVRCMVENQDCKIIDGLCALLMCLLEICQ
jgi:hypothetical protein